jgi:hypothetical protein
MYKNILGQIDAFWPKVLLPNLKWLFGQKWLIGQNGFFLPEMAFCDNSSFDKRMFLQ